MSAPSEVGYALHGAGIGNSDDGGGSGEGDFSDSEVQKMRSWVPTRLTSKI